MEDKKYYTPSIQDICIDYECEIRKTQRSEEWQKHKWYAENYADCGQDIIEVRVSYLTKGDIERCNWIYEISNDTENIYTKENYILHHYSGFTDLRIHKRNEYLMPVDPSDKSISCIYNGYCKSINELKKIEQLLAIL